MLGSTGRLPAVSGEGLTRLEGWEFILILLIAKLLSSLRLLIGSPCLRWLAARVLLPAARLSDRLRISAPSFAPTIRLNTQRVQTNHMSQFPTLTPLSFSNVCGAYLRAQFKYRLNERLSSASTTQPEYPLILLVAVVSELDTMADTLVDAFFNHS